MGGVYSSEHLLREIARIEADIEELVAYRAEIKAHNRAASGWWARYKSGLRVIMVRRQIENHLRFLRLEREMAYDSYRNLERDKPSSVS